ncbi:MAG: hypothetical protein FH749_14375 [Firmicutes bacterium]|nr:hypothetical protein [Bacillota bacterium]
MIILRSAAVIVVCTLVLVGSTNLPVVETNSYFTSSDSRDIVVYVKEETGQSGQETMTTIVWKAICHMDLRIKK